MFSTKLNLITSTMRPFQWIKNGLLFVALIFSGNLTNMEAVSTAVFAFLVFSALSSSVYIINDIQDRQRDLTHPVKSKRPIASGHLPVGLALPIAILLAMGAIIGALYINTNFAIISISYLTLFITYSFFLKHIAIVDLLIIASGFVIRAAAGAIAIGVTISSWLLLCTMLLALFIIIGKRRHEVNLLGEDSADHRDVLTNYSTILLDQMIAIVTAATLITYSLYTISIETVSRFGTENLRYTIPFVLYGLFRYLYIIYMKKEGGMPERDILSDVPTIINTALWAITIAYIIYLG